MPVFLSYDMFDSLVTHPVTMAGGIVGVSWSSSRIEKKYLWKEDKKGEKME